MSCDAIDARATSSPSCRVGSKKRISGSASSPDRSEEKDRPRPGLGSFWGKKQTGDCRWGIEVESVRHHDKIIHHRIITTGKEERRPNKTPPHGIFRPHHGREPTVGHRPPHNVEAPQVCHGIRESASLDPSHAKRVAEAHTATNWISFVGASPSLPPSRC